MGYGEWGIVDTWRRKKPEFWGTKKAYSPTRILVKQLTDFQAGKALRIPVHNRFDHTNFDELAIKWEYAGQSGELNNFKLEPHKKGALFIPANNWAQGEKLHISFHQNDTMLVDQYNIQLGNRVIDLPVCKPGNLEISETEAKISIQGSTFVLDLNRQTGLLENVIIYNDTIIKSGPYINLRVPGERVQYSTIAMDDHAKDWKCKKFSFAEDNGIATIFTKGEYKKLMADITIKIDERGIINIDYSVEHSIQGQTVQEAGLKFITGNSFEKQTWDRNPYFTAYPEGALGRAKGEVDLTQKPGMSYREEPHHSWEMDSKGFYYFGLDKELPYTNMVRSLKENIYSFSLTTGINSGIEIFSNADQACRFDRINGNNTLIVNDLWDYNSLLWGNYMKQIPLEPVFQGHVCIALSE